jgi:hypothetical protein
MKIVIAIGYQPSVFRENITAENRRPMADIP